MCVGAGLLLALQVASGPAQEREKAEAEAKARAIAEAKHAVGDPLRSLVLAEVTRDTLGSDEQRDVGDWHALGHVAIDRNSKLRIAVRPLAESAWNKLKEAGITQLCVAAQWSGATEPTELPLEADSPSSETEIARVPKGKEDDFDLTLRVESVPCRNAPSEKNAVPAIAYRQTVHVERLDFGFHLVLVDSVAWGWTNLPDTTLPVRTARHVQKLKAGVNAFFCDKFRDPKTHRRGKQLLRELGLNVTVGLTVAGPGIVDAGDTHDFSIGVVLTDPSRSFYVGLGRIWLADLENRRFVFFGVSGSDLLKLIKKL